MPQRLSDVELGSLAPETKTWAADGNPISLDHWIWLIGSYDHMIAYGELFWPDFVEHDGCILRKGFSEENYQGFMQQTGGDKGAVEAVMNHIDIDYLLNQTEGPSDDQAVYLGRLLQEMWQAKLEHDFPDRKFIVCFDPDDGETLYVQQEWAADSTG